MPALGLMGGVAQAKMAQAAVHYQADPKDGKRCDGCNFFIAPNGCKTVVGDIAPTGWCSLWVKKAGSATAAPRLSRAAARGLKAIDCIFLRPRTSGRPNPTAAFA
jgi:hypothetical protein